MLWHLQDGTDTKVETPVETEVGSAVRIDDFFNLIELLTFDLVFVIDKSFSWYD